ncbi:cytochrome P450 1A5-like isoform 1-T1 [Morphnus guianensis]
MKAAMSLVGSQGIVSATEVFLVAAAFCLVFLLIQSFRQHVPKGLKSPPGPRGYPILGNVLELRKDTHLALTRLSQKYGDVMEVRIGTRPILVLSGLDTIKQALVKQGEDFMGRPDLHSFQYISNGQSLAFSPDSGEVWKARRRLAQNTLKTFSIAPSPTSSSTCLLEEHVSKEADYLVTKFLQLMDEEKSFDLNRYLVVSVANVICAMCFGKRYDHNDQELLNIVNVSDQFSNAAAAGNPADFIPMLRYLPSRTMSLFKDFNKRFLHFLQKIVQEHYKTYDKNNIRDITDSLIEQCLEKKVEANTATQIPKEKVVNPVNDLFGAGFDSVTTGLSWSLMYLVTYPDIQKKIQEELGESLNLLPPGPKPLRPGLTPALLSSSRRPDHRPGEETEAVRPRHAALHRSLYPGDVQALLLPALHHPAQASAEGAKEVEGQSGLEASCYSHAGGGCGERQGGYYRLVECWLHRGHGELTALVQGSVGAPKEQFLPSADFTEDTPPSSGRGCPIQLMDNATAPRKATSLGRILTSAASGAN